MNKDREHLRRSLQAIDDAQRYATAARDDELHQVWAVFHLMLIGEAASRLSAATRAMAPEVPWRQIIAVRNRIVHGYAYLDLRRVWSIVDLHLPPLRLSISRLLSRLDENA